MNLKWIGAVMVITACGTMGWARAAAHRREEMLLGQLIGALELMLCELQYHLTPLPELCRIGAEGAGGCVGQVLSELEQELQRQISPDAALCMQAALTRVRGIPASVRNDLARLGDSLGRFDLQGQLRGLETVIGQCRSDLAKLTVDRDARLRSYQTLGLCAGVALAIVLF